MKDKVEYITKEKHQEFEKELEHLKKVKRREVAENLEYAKSLGDLSENAEYHEARDMQATIEDRILRLESILKNSKIVSGHHTDAVSVGSKVTLKKEGGAEKVYTIVGTEESDIASGKISVQSPLGAAVFGKKKGEHFTFRTPGGEAAYKVTDIK